MDGDCSGQGDYAELMELSGRLDGEVEAMRNAGCQYARNEREYRKALRVAILRERTRGTPVTITGDLCRGTDEIADLKCARDCSEALYKAAQESINVIKLRIRTVSAQMDREWSAVGR
jgi:hypothetical protein